MQSTNQLHDTRRGHKDSRCFRDSELGLVHFGECEREEQNDPRQNVRVADVQQAVPDFKARDGDGTTSRLHTLVVVLDVVLQGKGSQACIKTKPRSKHRIAYRDGEEYSDHNEQQDGAPCPINPHAHVLTLELKLHRSDRVCKEGDQSRGVGSKTKRCSLD